MTAMAIGGSCAKLGRAQVFDCRPRVSVGGVSSETHLRIRRHRGKNKSAFIASRTNESLTDVIIIDNSDGEAAFTISVASRHHKVMDMETEGAGVTAEDSGIVRVGSHTVFERDARDDGGDIQGCAQLCIRKQLL